MPRFTPVVGKAIAALVAATVVGACSGPPPQAPSITLKSGKIKTFWLEKSVNAATLKVGQKVTVSYEMANKKPTASAVATSQ